MLKMCFSEKSRTKEFEIKNLQALNDGIRTETWKPHERQMIFLRKID